MSTISDRTLTSLEVRDGSGRVWQVPLQGPRMVIGRSAQAQVRIDSQTVSRQHAELFRDPFNRWWVRDLGSRNGTFVNGRNVKESPLSVGDVIQIEDALLKVRGAGATSPPSTRPTTTHVKLQDVQAGPVQPLSQFRAPQIKAAHLARLREFGGKLLNTEDRGRRLEMLCELMIGEDFSGHSAGVLRLRHQQPQFTAPEMVCGFKFRVGFEEQSPYMSQSTLRAAYSGGQAVVASTTPRAAGVVEMSIVADVYTKRISAVACPLTSDDEGVDVLYATFPDEFGTGEWLHLTAMAAEEFCQTDAAWLARLQAQDHARIEGELERAKHIQMRLVPRQLSVPGMDLALGFTPCRWVGGDYVDVVPIGDGTVFLAVADVCGKGLQAALVSASLHSMIHTNVAGHTDLASLMSRLNDYLRQSLPDESFVTMIGMVLDPRRGKLLCVNAGHPPAFVFSAAGQGAQVRELASALNAPLGIDEMSIEVQEYTLQPRELLALYTDGLTELVNESDQMLGMDGLRRMLADSVPAATAGGAQAAAQKLREQLDAFAAGRLAQDDQTFLLAHRL